MDRGGLALVRPSYWSRLELHCSPSSPGSGGRTRLPERQRDIRDRHIPRTRTVIRTHGGDEAMSDWMQRYWDAWNSHDADRVAEMMAETVTFADVGLGTTYQGRDAVRAF